MRIIRMARGAALLCALMAITWASTAAVSAQDPGPNRVGLVVVHGNGQTVQRCVEFDEEQITGLELVQRAGLETNLDDTNALGTAVCRLAGEGCSFPEESCFCRCEGSPCVYWSYWNWTPGNGWRYSNTSAAIRSLGDGEVDGWFWGENDFSAGSPLPDVTFEEICPAPTAVPTATETATATDAPSPIPPTRTPVPDSIDESAGSPTRTPLPRRSEPPAPTPGSTPVLTGNTAATPLPTQTSPPATATRQPSGMGVIVATPTPAGGGAATVTPAAPTAAPSPSEEVGAPPGSGATAAPTPVAVARLAPSATPRPTRSGATPTPLLALVPAPAAARQVEAPPSRPAGILLAAAIALGAAGACGVGLVVAKKKT
jgi:hypothetical protein